MTVEVRPATLDDLPGIEAVAIATDQSAQGTAADPRYDGHLLTHGRLVVATEADEVAGYAATVDVGGVDQLCDLFVLPERHGEGIGRRLLDQVWSGAPDRSTFSSQHASALPLYIRAGMRPLWPLVYVRGEVSSLPTDERALVVHVVSAAEAAETEEGLGGGPRRPEYEYWAVRPDARLLVVRDGSEVIGVGATGGQGADQEVSHVRCKRPTEAMEVLTAILQQLAGPVLVAVPGPNLALPTLVDSGWRIIDVDYYMATSDGLVDPSLVFPHAGLM